MRHTRKTEFMRRLSSREVRVDLTAGSFVFILFFLVFGLALAQEPEQPPATPMPTPQPQIIPASEIPSQAAAAGPMLRKAESKTDFSDQLSSIGEDFSAERVYLAELEDETLRRLQMGGPASVIEESEKTWIRTAERLDRWLQASSNGAAAIEVELEKLARENERWDLTLASADENQLPTAVRKQVEETLAAIDATRRRMQESRDAVLTLQSEISREKALVEEMMVLQREEFEARQRGLLGLDSPPLWGAFGVPGVDGAPSEQMAAVWSKNFGAVRDYVKEQKQKLYRHALFLVLLTALLIFLHFRVQLWVRQDESLKTAAQILERPFAAALVITVLLGDPMHPRAPSAWFDFLGLLLLIAILRLLPKILTPTLRFGAYFLALLYFLARLVGLAPDGNLVNRLALLALSLTAASACIWLFRALKRKAPAFSGGWVRAISLFSRVSFLLFVIGAFANLIGGAGFASYLVLSTLNSAFAAVLYWVAAVLIQSIVRVLLLTSAARSFGVVRLHADTVRQTLFRMITVLAAVGWVMTAIYEFGGLAKVARGIDKLLGGEISIGDFTIAPADILIFVVIAWLSFKISRLLRFVLDTDIMPRMDLPRGVPGAINRLTHYAIIVVGFMIAATAAGLDFSRVTLIVGALGVGIGFGLQNVVNNFVSGLILLFERPIRVGDKVQVGELFGVVKIIGMRASVVRTYQGAEVIVPNANLISTEVINWTLSDDRRRVEIQVGVAYGTPPECVIDLLVSVAEAHAEVLGDPAPQALFIGFGDSSLDFELRAWTLGDYVRVSSDLLVGIEQALAAAGIEIPFPQRDLHLRTKGKGISEVAESPDNDSEGGDRAEAPGDDGVHGVDVSGDR